MFLLKTDVMIRKSVKIKETALPPNNFTDIYKYSIQPEQNTYSFKCTLECENGPSPGHNINLSRFAG